MENIFYILTVLDLSYFDSWHFNVQQNWVLSSFGSWDWDEFENSPCFFLKHSEKVEEGWDKDSAVPKGYVRGTKQSSPFRNTGEYVARRETAPLLRK